MSEIIVGDLTTGEPLLSSEQVASRANIAATTLKRRRAEGRVPEPDGWIGRTPVWRESTIDEWLQHRRPRGRPKTASD